MNRKPHRYVPPPPGSVSQLHWFTRLLFIIGVASFVALLVNALLEAFS